MSLSIEGTSRNVVEPNVKYSPRNEDLQLIGKVTIAVICIFSVAAGITALTGRLPVVGQYICWGIAGAGSIGLALSAYGMNKLRKIDVIISKGKKSDIGSTPLIVAIEKNKAVDRLLWMGANPSKPDSRNKTPLEYAQNNKKLTQLLLHYGAKRI